MKTLVYIYDQIKTGLDWCAGWVSAYPKTTVLVFVTALAVALAV